MDKDRLKGKRALVTGAASGIGRATSLRLAAEGATVFCCDIVAAGVEETVSMIAAQGGKAASGTVDVSKLDSCEAIARASEANRDIDSLVDGVFAERLREGQLDECDLTMRELQALAASFKATLTAVYHPRVPYPEPTPEELANLARIAQA